MQNPSKFYHRATRCVFSGYPYGKKEYHFYDLNHHKTYIFRDVLFYEDHFPFAQSSPEQTIRVLPIPFDISNNIPTNSLQDQVAPFNI